MVNENIKLTKENEIAKSIILNNYKHNDISIAYGCFYTIDGRFTFGKDKDSKDVMIFQKASKIESLELCELTDVEIIKALDYIGLQRREEKVNIEEKSKNVEKTQPMTLFDFM